jgi:hypothetical protein
MCNFTKVKNYICVSLVLDVGCAILKVTEIRPICAILKLTDIRPMLYMGEGRRDRERNIYFNFLQHIPVK